ncbi:MarR family winged helix-turn-helix transcriptional regulator [Paracoccus albus]|uniref:MarR family winged helix-turn-helix transcriptional regulator n=1 Tax=Paracoccus albus TaxID=3017784 RepID=UPI0022F1382B|nr:MarR family winged helix-turn-helix transcriptional regulator [Paracoccus albus]WBU60564.1 MarR family winged helix-turn-helix transcriptional regulator [Paracoccus albus]
MRDDDSQQSSIDIDLLLPFQLTQLSAKLAAQARVILARHGKLSLPQWRIIRIVGMQVADRSTAVRKSSGIDKGQFSKTVNALVEEGYIATAPCKTDQRQFVITLTDRGHAAHDRLAPELDARQRHLLSSLTPEQRELVFPIIRALAQAAETTDFTETQSDEE